MFHHPRTWLGLLLALLGIVTVRLLSAMVESEGWATLIYLVGIALALGGLALVASAMQVTFVSGIPCPRCYLVNRADAEKCARCTSPLAPSDGIWRQ